MKSISTILATLAITLQVSAQEVPKPSPSASVTQRVGLNDITVDYSRPGIKNRTIWGDLVPYGELWRAGANKATSISFSAPAMINGNTVEAGSYSLFIQPEKDNMWTVVINGETELWGTSDYKKENDVARFPVDVSEVDWRTERLEYRFTEVDINTATLVMDWAGRQVIIRIESDPMEQVLTNIQRELDESKEEDKWKIYRNAASFAKDINLTAKGIEWIDQSLKMKENWYSRWIYADLMAQKKDYKGAIKQAEMAIAVGKKAASEDGKEFKYEADLNEEIAGWKAMM